MLGQRPRGHVVGRAGGGASATARDGRAGDVLFEEPNDRERARGLRRHRGVPVVMMRETPSLSVCTGLEVGDRAIQQPVVVVGLVERDKVLDRVDGFSRTGRSVAAAPTKFRNRRGARPLRSSSRSSRRYPRTLSSRPRP